jgi:DNA mismatch repair protein MutL
LKFLGQILGTYLVCEAPEELVLIDQHAAHERVTYQRLRLSLEREGRLASQQLLLPLNVELDALQQVTLEEHRELFTSLGFSLESFGGDTWTVRAIPSCLVDQDPRRGVLDLLDQLAEEEEPIDAICARRHALLLRLACHGSVRAGKLLQQDEVRALLHSLDSTEGATSCPHGRPVLLRLPRGEIERRFSRR